MMPQDNLDAQKSDEYTKTLKRKRTTPWFGMADGTDWWQPVDQGYGREIKRQCNILQDDWLEDDDNLTKWEDNKLTASDKRVALTHWIAGANKYVNENLNIYR